MALVPDCDLFVLTGERSGDAYGGAIVERLRQRLPDLAVAAMGGEHLRAAGAEIEQDSEGLAVMGFLPVLARLPFFLRLGRRLMRRIEDRRPRVVLTIDYPGFNLRLLRRLQHLRGDGVRFIHLVAPQVWAWKPRRAKVVAGLVDRLLCFFPFEPRLFTCHGGRADFVGHPLADLVSSGQAVQGVEAELGLDPLDQLLLLAPGSRSREIGALLPVFDAAWRLAMPRLRDMAPGRVVAAVSKTPDLDRDRYRQLTDLPLVEGDYRALCARSHLGVIASGTATLEAAILGLPHIITYRSDPLQAAIARQVILTEHIGLPNIVHDERLCPEVLQWDLTPERLAARIVQYWQADRHARLRDRLGTTRALLGGGGAMERIAGVLADELADSAVPVADTTTEALD